MLTLAFESSAKAASVALCRDGELLSQSFQCTGLTHSRTLLPMAQDLIKNSERELSDIDVFAVAHGPGSFTGIRIGVSAVKGLAWALEKPVIGVSTLEAMAWQGLAAVGDAIICPIMDARRGEVYNALFDLDGGAPSRRCPDRAISLDALAGELMESERPLLLIGDGAKMGLEYLTGRGISAALPPAPLLHQSAWGVAMAAAGREPLGVHELIPEYLRLSQAERQRQEALDKKSRSSK